jgi:PucR C-terminal helix-turn-helix domain
MRGLATTLDRSLLAVRQEEEPVWAGWLGGQRPLAAEEALSTLADLAPDPGEFVTIGEPGEGLSGWRFSHLQAKAAMPIAERRGRPVLRYADVAVLASITSDDLTAASLRQLYLAPLERAGDDGKVARETLRAYFDAERNISSTAAALGVDRRTVRNRIRAIEELLGRPLRARWPIWRSRLNLIAAQRSVSAIENTERRLGHEQASDSHRRNRGSPRADLCGRRLWQPRGGANRQPLPRRQRWHIALQAPEAWNRPGHGAHLRRSRHPRRQSSARGSNRCPRRRQDDRHRRGGSSNLQGGADRGEQHRDRQERLRQRDGGIGQGRSGGCLSRTGAVLGKWAGAPFQRRRPRADHPRSRSRLRRRAGADRRRHEGHGHAHPPRPVWPSHRAQVPKIAGGAGSVTKFEAKVGRKLDSRRGGIGGAADLSHPHWTRSDRSGTM